MRTAAKSHMTQLLRKSFFLLRCSIENISETFPGGLMIVQSGHRFPAEDTVMNGSGDTASQVRA